MKIKIYSAFIVLMCLAINVDAQTDFAKIIANVAAETKINSYSTSENTKVGVNMGLLNSSGQFSDLTYGTITDYDNDIVWSTHLSRLRSFALGYTTSDSRSTHYGEAALYSKIVLGLQYFNANGQNYVNANWWYIKINNPMMMGQILILMRGGASTLSSTDENNGITYMAKAPDPMTLTGANLTDAAMHYLYRGALTSNLSMVSAAVSGAFSTLSFVNRGNEGLNTDYSFLQHGPELYTQGYGWVWIAGIYKFAYYIRTTSYGMTQSQLNTAYTFLHNSYYGAARGKFKDFSLDGRSSSRAGSNAGISIVVARQALMVDNDPAHVANLVADTVNFKTGTISAANAFVSPKHIHYWNGDYTLHNRPGYQFTVYGVSTRTNRSEGVTNNENILNEFGTDGVTNIRVKGDEYYQIFPVWDWNQVPGITMRQISPAQHNTNHLKPGSTSFVGGVSDSTYGAFTYQLNFYGVTGYKSNFFFDDEVVCLGAGITSAQTESICTNVNQTVLSGPVSINNGSTSTLTTNTQNTYNNTLQWTWHNSVGYFFPNGGNITVSNKTQTGSWAAINPTQSPAIVNTNVFKLYFDHGVAPSGGSYSYIVVPNITSSGAATYNTGNIKIISNTSSLQAVKHSGLNILQVIFAAAGTVTDSASGLSVTVDRPCALMVKNIGSSKVTVSVSDPSQLTTSIKISIKFSPGGKLFPTFFNTPSGNYAGNSNTFTVDSTASAIKYAAIADAYVNGGTPSSTNFGTAISLVVKNNGVNSGLTRETYLKFDLHGLIGKWTHAKLRLYGSANTGAASVKLGAYKVADNTWTETGITYNNRPVSTNLLDSIQGKIGGTYREWNISDAIKTMGTDSVISIKIAATMIGNSTSDVTYSSRENSNVDQRPCILIDSVPALVNSIGAVADAYVNGGTSASTNFGTTTGLVVKNVGTNNSLTRETYLKFDMHGAVPANLMNAKLKLYGTGNTGAAAVNWSVYKVTDNQWTETGITYANRPEGSIKLDSIPGHTGAAFSEWDITGAVKSMSSDSILSVKVLNTTLGNSTSDITFSSRESSILNRRPAIVFSVDNPIRAIINYVKAKPLNVLQETAAEKPLSSDISVRQAVSPNGDGVNDVFLIDGLQNYPDNHLLIINSNGRKVYESLNYDNVKNVFAGRSNQGQYLPAGTYFYILNYRSEKSNRKLSGFLVLKF